MKNKGNIQFYGIHGLVAIFCFISNNLGNFIHQIRLKFGPDQIRGVLGSQKSVKKNQLAKEFENQRTSRFVPGQKVDCEIVELQKDKRKIALSIKTLEEKTAKEVLKKYGSTD